MFQNYILSAFRTLMKNKQYAFINIGGLSIGLAAVILISLFVKYETSYDAWLPNADNIYKVEFTETEPGHEPLLSAKSPAPLAPALLKDYAGIDVATRTASRAFTIRQGARQFTENVTLADENFFDVYDLPVVMGNRNAALSSNTGVAISEEMAKKYFGDTNPIGKTLNFNGTVDHQVAAVFKNIPDNSHFDMGFITLLTMDPETPYGVRLSWGGDSVHTYIKTKAGFDPSIIETDQKGFAERNITLNWTDLSPALLHHYNFLPIQDIHLYSKNGNHEKPVSDITIVVTFTIIAFTILGLGVINFTNLSTAQAQKRAREVSLRKVLGASRPQLMRQFLGEALLTSTIALFISLAMAELSLPYFNDFLGQSLNLAPLAEPIVILGIMGLVILTGLTGGFYPALVLSNIRPATILRANKSGAEAAPWFRNSLVILQFSVAITLIAATSIVYLQTNYVRSVDLGFSPSGKIVIPTMDGRFGPSSTVLKNRLSQIQGVKAVSSTTLPLPMVDGPLAVIVPPQASRDQAQSISSMVSDTELFKLLRQTPLAGRLFSADRRVDFRKVPADETQPITRGAVLNVAATKLLGFERPEDAVGKTVINPRNGRDTIVSIVGVVENAHFDSLHSTIKPMIFFASENPLFYIMIDIDETNQAQIMQDIEQVWTGVLPGVSMAPTYLKDAYAALYRETDRQGQMFGLFAVFAILVASLGLYGLAAHMAERRTKEIGIRKVVGARIRDIVSLLTWQFSKPVMFAAPLGILLAVWSMSDWLQGFAYRISLSNNAWVFLASALIAFIIAWATVGGHALRVARSNPIMALRAE